MGYQESLIPIACLAEAEGIRDAIEAYARVHGEALSYFCATRMRDQDNLYAVVGGQRHPYQSARPYAGIQMEYVESYLGWEDPFPYDIVFEDVGQDEVTSDANLHVKECFAARANMIAFLRHVDEECDRMLDQGEVTCLSTLPPNYKGKLKAGESIGSAYSDLVETSLGYLIMVGDGASLQGLRLEDETSTVFGATLSPKVARGPWYPDGTQEPFAQARSWIEAYFTDERPDPADLPLAPHGSEAKLAILEAIKRIPYGKLATYSEVAKEVSAQRGKRMSAAVVKRVVEHNPLPIIIPSHRVVSTTGAMATGTVSMADAAWLLAHEGVDLNSLYIPASLAMPHHPSYDLFHLGDHELPRVLSLVGRVFGGTYPEEGVGDEEAGRLPAA